MSCGLPGADRQRAARRTRTAGRVDIPEPPAAARRAAGAAGGAVGCGRAGLARRTDAILLCVTHSTKAKRTVTLRPTSCAFGRANAITSGLIESGVMPLMQEVW